jgi:hypothetical protein
VSAALADPGGGHGRGDRRVSLPVRAGRAALTRSRSAL